ncbi:MAG TPA: hypothetical protein VGP94_04320, partial [Tepidisphaeraceae bacterium]|nr:hypothetical protein [Tepidisphaeraceae bacterium]
GIASHDPIHYLGTHWATLKTILQMRAFEHPHLTTIAFLSKGDSYKDSTINNGVETRFDFPRDRLVAVPSAEMLRTL